MSLQFRVFAAVSLLLAVFLIAPAADAAGLRSRAREQFDTGIFNSGSGNVRLQGFSSAFNVWWEEPFRNAYGLTIHRGSLRQAGTKNKFTATSVGVEAKVFPLAVTEAADGHPVPGWQGRWFGRLGILSTALDPAGPPKAGWAHGLTVGTGLEFPVWKLGLAPEIGSRLQVIGGSGKRAVSFYASIGIHFYVFPKK
jgi:hypothetical protein